MGRLIIHNQITVNGAFESPSPETWLELDNDSHDAGMEQIRLADALVLGRRRTKASRPSGPTSATIRRSDPMLSG